MTATDIETIVDQTLRETLGPYGFERADVRPYIDHAGDDALEIVAHFNPSAVPAAQRPAAKAMGTLRKRLLTDGEERFPYLSFSFPGEEILLDDATAAE